MGTSFAVVNSIQDSGKTTITINLAYVLGSAGNTTCVVDLDHRSSASRFLLQPEQRHTQTYTSFLMDFLTGKEVSIHDIVYRTRYRNVSIVPNTPSSAALEHHLAFLDDRGIRFFAEKVRAELAGKFDYILFDCPSSLGLFSMQAIVGSDHILVPADVSRPIGVSDFATVLGVLEQLVVQVGGDPRSIKVLLNQFAKRKSMAVSVMEQVLEGLSEGNKDGTSTERNERFLKTVIPHSKEITEALAKQKLPDERNPGSTLGRVFRTLAKELTAPNA